jgi:amino acid adenylation domain-containing protein
MASLHSSFEAQMRRTPDAIAVISGDRRVTYAELNGQADGIACELENEWGVTPGELVGTCASGTIDGVTAMLGVLKTGAAYVPLDAAHPDHRLSTVLHDARIRIVVAEPTLVERVRSLGGALRTVLSSEPRRDVPRPGSRPLNEDPDRLAYVMYTSGSTGTPKGVMITHRSVLSLLSACRQVIASQRPGLWLTQTSLAFDLSVLEIYGALIQGHTLEGVTTLGLLGALRAAAAGLRQQPTHLQCTPSLLAVLADDAQALDAIQRLDCLIVGGERLPLALARRTIGASDLRIFHAYGPTEATVWAAIGELKAPVASVRIGPALPDTRLLVLGRDLCEVDTGEIGEICISGPGIANGYLNRPSLTADRFVPDAFSAEEGRRIYRTGDLARLTVDGSLEFVGRDDRQLKIHGVRIELGEIESTLLEHPLVREAVAVPHPDGQGTVRLEAFVSLHLDVARAEAVAIANALCAFARTQLPSPFVPSHITILSEFPLTPTGKVDHRRLLEHADWSRATTLETRE